MKRHNSRLKKKGAIEMSMQTIIVVVIGVTLLTLGLKFVYDTFADISDTQDKMADLTAGELENLFGSEANPVNVQNQITLKQGQSNGIDVTLVNIGKQKQEATLDISVAAKGNHITTPDEEILDWLIYASNPETFIPGNAKKTRVIFDIPTNAIPGNYIFDMKFGCSGDTYPCGEKASLTMIVQS